MTSSTIILKICILLLISVTTSVISSPICSQEPCSIETTTNEDFYNEESYTEVSYIEESYNEELEKCAKKGPMMMPVYYDNVDKYLCHALLYPGPCGRGHWLVANKFAEKPLAECQKKKCENDEIMFHDECRENNSTTMCGEFQILLLNPFGEGNNCDQKSCMYHGYFE